MTQKNAKGRRGEREKRWTERIKEKTFFFLVFLLIPFREPSNSFESGAVSWALLWKREKDFFSVYSHLHFLMRIYVHTIYNIYKRLLSIRSAAKKKVSDLIFLSIFFWSGFAHWLISLCLQRKSIFLFFKKLTLGKKGGFSSFLVMKANESR